MPNPDEILIAVPHDFSAPVREELRAYRSSVKETLDACPYCPRCGKWYRYRGIDNSGPNGERRELWRSDCLCYLRQTAP